MPDKKNNYSDWKQYVTITQTPQTARNNRAACGAQAHFFIRPCDGADADKTAEARRPQRPNIARFRRVICINH